MNKLCDVFSPGKEGYVRITIRPEHKRLVTITPQGTEIVTRARRLLDSHFDQLMVHASVDAQRYSTLTEQLYQTLRASLEEEQS